MTRREVLTNLVCAYITTNHGLPKMDNDGNLSKSWLNLVDAIHKVPTEENDFSDFDKKLDLAKKSYFENDYDY